MLKATIYSPISEFTEGVLAEFDREEVRSVAQNGWPRPVLARCWVLARCSVLGDGVETGARRGARGETGGSREPRWATRSRTLRLSVLSTHSNSVSGGAAGASEEQDPPQRGHAALVDLKEIQRNKLQVKTSPSEVFACALYAFLNANGIRALRRSLHERVS